jgi:tartrate dehydratase alpha subunit/fumarate hydratase class I-like protein
LKTIEPDDITKEVIRLAIEAATYLEKDVLDVLECAKNKECGLAKSILEQIKENDN